MFGGPRLLDASPADKLTAENAAELVARATDVTVLLRGPAAASAAVRKALGEHATFETFRTPTGMAVPERIAALAALNQVTLEPAVRTLLVERGKDDLARVGSVLAQLGTLGMTHPSAEQVSTLLGSTSAAAVPWALADALDVGDVPAALTVAGGLEPVAAVSYLASRTGQLGRIVDDGMQDPAEVAGAFGMSSSYAAGKLLQVARRIGPGGVAASWNLLAAADRRIKLSPNPAAALDVLLVELAAVWSATS